MCLFVASPNVRADIRDGLVAYWPLYDAGGTTADELINGLDGSLNGDPTSVAGAVGGALDVDGAGDFVSCGFDPLLMPEEEITLQAWVYVRLYDYYESIAANIHDTGSSEGGYWLGTLADDAGNYFGWGITTGGALVYGWTPAVYQENTWYHLVATYKSGEMRLWVNGSLTDGIDLTSVVGNLDYTEAPDEGFLIGRYEDDDETHDSDAIIDEVAVWNRALTADEVSQLWNDGNGMILAAVGPIEPAINDTIVPVTTDLSWTSAEFAAGGYDLYFGADPNILSPHYDWEKVIPNQLVNSWDPPAGPGSGNLAYLTKYYWQVDVYEPNDLPGGLPTLTVGRVWSFTTASPLPVVTTHPQSQVAVGGAAEFTVAGANIENYEWWMSVDDSTDTPSDDISQGSGPTMDTLTLSGVVSDDEGYYYCVVSNDGGASTDKSNTARLITARLVGRWTFDAEDYSDSSDSDNTGIPTGDPTFVVGLVGDKALELDGNDFVAIDTVANDLAANDVTLSAWVKTTNADGRLIACNTASYGNVIMLQVWDMVASTYPGGSGTTTVNDDTWRLLTYVRNGSNDYIYVNGTEEYTGTADFNLATDNLWSIGQEWDTGPTASDFLIGTVDDVRIYNYALPHDEVAQLYVDVMGGYACKKALYYDMDGDCIVGISDFAAYAAKWMDCNFIPVEDCP